MWLLQERYNFLSEASRRPMERFTSCPATRNVKDFLLALGGVMPPHRLEVTRSPRLVHKVHEPLAAPEIRQGIAQRPEAHLNPGGLKLLRRESQCHRIAFHPRHRLGDHGAARGAWPLSSVYALAEWTKRVSRTC